MMLAAAITGAQSAVPPAPDAPAGPLEHAIAHYQTVESYRVNIRSSHASTDGNDEHILYYYKKPGYVRMEFFKPHSGALLVYDPNTRRVRLWPFGYGHFPELNFSPLNPLIKSSGGQHVDRSDVGVLFADMRALQEHGSTELLGAETLDGRTVQHLLTTGAGNFAFNGVHQYELWLDTASEFPAKVIARDARLAVMETVLMDAPELNPVLPDTTFNP